MMDVISVQEFKCKCRGEKGSGACGNPTYENNGVCESCFKGKHSHEYYRHLDIPGGCFYAPSRVNPKKRVCLICESNTMKVM